MMENNESDMVFQGNVFSVVREPYVAPNGNIAYFEFAQTKDTVRVYPVTKEGELLLISEDRYGIHPKSISTVLRVVAGAIEAGETPEEAALRELREEIGFAGRNPTVFHSSYPILKVRNRVFHTLVDAVKLSEFEPHPDCFEHIKIIPVKLDEIESKVWNGDFMEDIVAFGLLKMMRYIKEGHYAAIMKR